MSTAGDAPCGASPVTSVLALSRATVVTQLRTVQRNPLVASAVTGPHACSSAVGDSDTERRRLRRRGGAITRALPTDTLFAPVVPAIARKGEPGFARAVAADGESQ